MTKFSGKRLVQMGMLGVLLLCGLSAALGQGEGTRYSLDHGWLFHEGDIAFPVISGQDASYHNAKAGTASGAAGLKFDDAAWKHVTVPHDWAVEQPFEESANSNQGYRARGMGWYRRYFKLDAADHGKHLEIQLDGIATHATVWVNGSIAARNWSGYNSIYIDITPVARFGDKVNVIAVQVDAVAQEGWWYEGVGLYRHTWLVKRAPVHIETDGVFANPVREPGGAWAIPIETTLYSSDKADATVEVESIVTDPAGHEVRRLKAEPVTVRPLESKVARMSIAMEAPQLWSPEQPKLYTIVTRVLRDGKVVDQVTTTAGFRTIRFDADKGFFLNDKPVKLMGTANHQDHAGVGTAVPDALWDFRVKRLKEMGSNFYRCAHNAPAREFLDVTDRQGMLVMDENRNFGAAPEQLEQLRWMVRRDRNHPSIILWSVFNEEPSQGSEMGYELVRRMRAEVRTLDTSRPVTAAQSGAMLSAVNASQAADVAGFNYRQNDYDAFHRQNPTKPVFSSEDTSTVMTRDEYATDFKAGVIDSYDDHAMPWGRTHRDAWKDVNTRPFMAGDVVWTGFDYRGETQPLLWPSAGASFGAMDLCGFPKTAYYIHQAQWIKDRPILQIVPHWNWAGNEGKPIKVMVISNAQSVRLMLNGKQVAAGAVDPYAMATFEVPYAAGKLEAIASTDAKEVARFAVETAGPAVAVRLVADRESLAGDGVDAEPVTVEVVDAKGRRVPGANAEIKFALSGPGAVIGVNDGDPTNHESEKGMEHRVFHGLAQVIVQAGPEAGELVLKATAEGLKGAEVKIGVKAVGARLEVPVAAAQ